MVQALANTVLIRNVVLILTGSDSVILQEARMRFPGWRGKADKVKFHLCSLSFHNFLHLTDRLPTLAMRNNNSDEMSLLYAAFKEYLIHGGYLTAINEYAKSGIISIATLDIYAEWIRGDILKGGHSEHFLQEVIGAIFKRLIIGSIPQTIHLKSRFSIENTEICSKLVKVLWQLTCSENILLFYIKAEGDVDMAYVKDKKFWPIEVKWIQQLRYNHLKQIRKYLNARIFVKVSNVTTTMDIPTIPLAMLELEGC